MENFTAAINALVAERDRAFLMRIAQDYKLPFEELQQKYLETADKAVKVPRKYKKREPKSVAVVSVPESEPEAPAPKVVKAKAEKQCCTAQTSKKEPCKFSALKGEVFCKRHLKQHVGENSDEEPKPVKKVTKKVEQPVHTHVLTTETDAECELCQSHGNPLETVETMFEVVSTPHTGPVKQMSAATRLALLMAEADEETDDDETAADLSVEEEAFEEDD